MTPTLLRCRRLIEVCLWISGTCLLFDLLTRAINWVIIATAAIWVGTLIMYLVCRELELRNLTRAAHREWEQWKLNSDTDDER